MTMTRISERTARTIARAAVLAALGLGLTACQPGAPEPRNEAEDAASATNSTALENDTKPETKSIIRPEIEPSPTPTPAAEPVMLTIAFPAKGAQPDAAGLAQLDGLIADPVYQMGGPVTLWGHSDSAGADAVNLAASRRRAEAVRDYLVGKGAPADRFTVIAMGEAQPIAPNRKRDGTDDPEGRDKNRRVEIKVDLPQPAPKIDAAAATVTN